MTPNRRTILVTGATGFLGPTLADALARAGFDVVRGGRSPPSSPPPSQTWCRHSDIGATTRWDEALAGIGTVLHLAGVAHLETRAAANAEEPLRQVNVEGTARLAAAAAAAGVGRFILMSSALVHGHDSGTRAFTEDSQLDPQTAYARSKRDAEAALQQAARDSAMAWVILRPPMVYGPGGRGSFARLVSALRRGLPLPLGCATAPKRFIGIDNLASAVVACAAHPAAANQTFLVCDAETTSSGGLVRHIADALGVRPWLPAVPAPLMRTALAAAGHTRDFERLFLPLQIDDGLIRARLGWSPPVSLGEGVRRAVAGSEPRTSNEA
jgi:nucleoside-diphosphate-sugar epimerase